MFMAEKARNGLLPLGFAGSSAPGTIRSPPEERECETGRARRGSGSSAAPQVTLTPPERTVKKASTVADINPVDELLGERETSGVTTQLILGYVEERGGTEAVEE